MISTSFDFSYAIVVFVIVFIAGNVINLLKYHFVLQLAGIAFLFTCFTFRSISFINSGYILTANQMLYLALPMFTAISACLISMVLGFWIFPPLRRTNKN